MKEKIINVKNMLKIVIMMLVIFSAIKSCSRATTNDDIIEYIGKLEDKGLLQEGCTTNVTTWINSYNYNFTGYNYIIGISASDSTYLPNRMFFCYTNQGITIKNNSSGYWNSFSASNQSKGLLISYGDLSWASGTRVNTNARRI